MFSRGDQSWDTCPQLERKRWTRPAWFFVGGQGASGTRGFRDVNDGLSKQIAMSERIKAKPGATKVTDGGISGDLGSSHLSRQRGTCLATAGTNGAGVYNNPVLFVSILVCDGSMERTR